MKQNRLNSAKIQIHWSWLYILLCREGNYRSCKKPTNKLKNTMMNLKPLFNFHISQRSQNKLYASNLIWSKPPLHQNKKITLDWTIVIAYRNRIDARILAIVEEISLGRSEMVDSQEKKKAKMPSQVKRVRKWQLANVHRNRPGMLPLPPKSINISIYYSTFVLLMISKQHKKNSKSNQINKI